MACTESLEACLRCYAALGNTGKPAKDEYSVLAGFVASTETGLQVLCVGTGTKCLPASGRSPRGLKLNDSHAEVLAKRALQLWITLELHLANTEEGSGFFRRLPHGTYARQPGWRLHFCCSQSPCGDASIHAQPGACLKTGAKLLGAVGALPGQSDVEPEGTATLGAVRRKPGKGEATLSVSCSDKLAKWVLLGCQGSLLSTLLTEPLFMDSITIACPRGVQNKAGRAACVQALQRAVQGRTANLRDRLGASAGPCPALEVIDMPQSAVELHLCPDSALPPAPCSINWVAGLPVEVTLGSSGLKAGVTRTVAAAKPEAAASRLCKSAMLARWGALQSNCWRADAPAGTALLGDQGAAATPEQPAASIGAMRSVGTKDQIKAKDGPPPSWYCNGRAIEHCLECNATQTQLTSYADVKARCPQRRHWELLTCPPSLLERWIPKPIEQDDLHTVIRTCSP